MRRNDLYVADYSEAHPHRGLGIHLAAHLARNTVSYCSIIPVVPDNQLTSQNRTCESDIGSQYGLQDAPDRNLDTGYPARNFAWRRTWKSL